MDVCIWELVNYFYDGNIRIFLGMTPIIRKSYYYISQLYQSSVFEYFLLKLNLVVYHDAKCINKYFNRFSSIYFSVPHIMIIMIFWLSTTSITSYFLDWNASFESLFAQFIGLWWLDFLFTWKYHLVIWKFCENKGLVNTCLQIKLMSLKSTNYT